MTMWWTLGVKAVNGGLFVVVFSLVAEMLTPKRFAGLFSAAPSVALANLIVVVIANGRGVGIADTRGMVIGAVALSVSCLVGVAAVRRHRALAGSSALILAWLAVALSGYAVFLR